LNCRSHVLSLVLIWVSWEAEEGVEAMVVWFGWSFCKMSRLAGWPAWSRTPLEYGLAEWPYNPIVAPSDSVMKPAATRFSFLSATKKLPPSHAPILHQITSPLPLTHRKLLFS
jgi:hypothetical protein